MEFVFGFFAMTLICGIDIYMKTQINTGDVDLCTNGHLAKLTPLCCSCLIEPELGWTHKVI